MAFQLLQDCIDMDVEMSASTHAVLVVLCRHANDAGECFPSTALIAKKAHLNPRTVMQAVRELEEGAWISCAQAPGKKRRFTLDVAKIKALVTPAENCTPAKSGTPVLSCTPAENCTPVKSCTPAGNNSEPLQETAVDPCKKLHPNKTIRDKEENISTSPAFAEAVEDFGLDDFSLQPETKPETVKAQKPKKAKEAKKTSAPHPLSFESLPEDWRKVCEQMHPDGNPTSIWAEFHFYWLSGKGAGTRRSDKGWATTWANWVRRCADRSYGRPAQQTNNAFAPVPKPTPGKVMCKPWFADEPANDEAADMVERMMK